MVGEQRRLGRDNLREPVFEGRGDAGVQLPAPVAQQGAVGGVLHQRVLEGVLRIGRCTAAVDQLGARQLRQGVVELPRRHRRHGADQLMRELAAERRPDLRHLAHQRRAVEPSQERRLQARGIARGRHRSRRGKTVAGIGQHAALDHCLGQLLDVGPRIAEIGEHPVAHILGDKTAILSYASPRMV